MNLLHIILDKRILIYAIGALGLVGIFIKICLSVTYKKFIRAADEVSTTETKWIKGMKNRFEAQYKLKIGTNNVDVFIRKHCMKARSAGMLLTTWEKLGGQTVPMCMILGSLGAFLALYLDEGSNSVILYLLLGGWTAGLILIVDSLTDISGKKLVLLTSLRDYFENMLKTKLEMMYLSTNTDNNIIWLKKPEAQEATDEDEKALLETRKYVAEKEKEIKEAAKAEKLEAKKQRKHEKEKQYELKQLDKEKERQVREELKEQQHLIAMQKKEEKLKEKQLKQMKKAENRAARDKREAMRLIAAERRLAEKTATKANLKSQEDRIGRTEKANLKSQEDRIGRTEKANLMSREDRIVGADKASLKLRDDRLENEAVLSREDRIENEAVMPHEDSMDRDEKTTCLSGKDRTGRAEKAAKKVKPVDVTAAAVSKTDLNEDSIIEAVLKEFLC